MTMNKSSILIIDDDANLRKTLTDILRAKGYETLAAKDGTEGLSLLRQHTVHLALVDLRLPDISGLEVLSTIRADHPHTEVIILTGNATLDSAIEATNKGAFTYLQKPYDIDQLILHIRHAIEKQQADEKIRQYQGHLEELVYERTQALEEAIIRAEASNRAKSEFLANMSHELTTPLNAVIGFSQVLKDGLYGELNDKQKEYVDDILQGGLHLFRILNEIIELSRLESGNQGIKPDRFLLKDALKSSVAVFNDKAIKRNLKLTIEIEPDAEIEIETDSGKLTRILYNLIDNAVKFTPDGGSVFVKAQKLNSSELRVLCSESRGIYAELSTLNSQLHGNFIKISVEDTGIGIKPENIDRLFQPFSQLEPPYTKSHGGTGIGLILTKKLVELLGGNIWVESEFGKGSKFTFTIPVLRGEL